VLYATDLLQMKKGQAVHLNLNNETATKCFLQDIMREQFDILAKFQMFKLTSNAGENTKSPHSCPLVLYLTQESCCKVLILIFILVALVLIKQLHTSKGRGPSQWHIRQEAGSPVKQRQIRQTTVHTRCEWWKEAGVPGEEP